MAVDADLEDTIRQQVDEWSSNSNECFTIELVKGDGNVAASFNPDFTYPIFGEEEAIFGYQDLDITLSFAAHNLRPHLSISHSKKFVKRYEIEPTDILGALHDFLPKSAFSGHRREESLRDAEAEKFAPPGDKVHEYERDGDRFEIWMTSLADPAAKEILENMQVLVPMFIEGGTMLELEQDWTTQRWKLFLLYQVGAPAAESSAYSLVGYGTSYRVFTFPDRQSPEQADIDLFTPSNQSIEDFLPPPNALSLPNDLAPTVMPASIASPLDLPSRERLSQFLILPTFRSHGHGRELYNTMYQQLTRPRNVREFTVEDPNEAFDSLRDLCDLVYLRAREPDFVALRIDPDVPRSALGASDPIPTEQIVSGPARAALQRRTKLMPRQFDRLVEMHTLAGIPPLNRSRSRITRKDRASNPADRAYYLWRLYVKQRLYIFNRDALAQVEREERVEKLEAALDSVQEAYVELLDRVEAAGPGARHDNGVAEEEERDVDAGAARKARLGKRKVVDEAEEDGEGEGKDEEGEGDETGAGHKKPRVR